MQTLAPSAANPERQPRETMYGAISHVSTAVRRNANGDLEAFIPAPTSYMPDSDEKLAAKRAMQPIREDLSNMSHTAATQVQVMRPEGMYSPDQLAMADQAAWASAARAESEYHNGQSQNAA